MISKIIRLKNIGLFLDAAPSQPIELGAATIIYAENGRGKSTLASVFRACSLGDGRRIEAQKTIDSDDPPEVQLLVQDGTNNTRVLFSNTSWAINIPEIMVFDSEFVDQNVYAGFEVSSGQKKSLLEFVLGDNTVNLKNRIIEITSLMEQATKERKSAKLQLDRFLGPFSVTDFISLSPNDQIENHLKKIEQRVTATKRSTKICNLNAPNNLGNLDFNLETTFQLLQKQIDDVASNAEDIVREHLKKHDSAQMEDWLSQGQIWLKMGCPFCGQSITGIELIQAYRLYFDQEYNNLKTDVNRLTSAINNKLGTSFISGIKSTVETNNIHIEAWQEHIDFSTLELDFATFKQILLDLRIELVELATQKQNRPLEAIGTKEQCKKLEGLLSAANQHIDKYNIQVKEISNRIANYKETIRTENLRELESERARLQAIQKRQSPEVVLHVSDFKDAVDKYTCLETEKNTIRTELDQLMNSTLEKYQDRVNNLVTSFHAEFSIEKMKADYRSRGNPRSNYGLVIRGKPIKLGKRDDMYTAHSFANALSEADKRTLAFAFFVARLEEDPKIDDRVVVLDDPVSSLDMNRRRATIRTIANLANRCRQLIILSHDAYFVRDLRNKLGNSHSQSTQPRIHEIRRASNGYSTFDMCDIDSICASPYYQHYQLLSGYVDGERPSNSRDVAKAIRPFLEGYLHRRFPNRIPRGMMFGQIIAHVRGTNPPDILANLRPILDTLSDINDYAKEFHHDTNPDADNAIINEAVLHTFAEKALNIVHQNG